jgi:hypothetical protein
MDRTPPTPALTLDQCFTARISAEQAILEILTTLTRTTGLDLAAVTVELIVRPGRDDEPQRQARTVRIDLAV